MADAQQLPKRNEVDPKLQWDLTTIFKDDAAFEEAFERIKKELPQAKSYQGTFINGPTSLLHALHFMVDILRRFEVIYVYSHLKNDQDTKNTTYQAMHSKASSLAAEVSEAFAFFEPELLALPSDTLEAYFKQENQLKEYRHYIETITKNKAHVLSQEQERLLAGAEDIFSSSSKTFSILNNADFSFPVVENEKGEQVQLSHGVYGQLMESTTRSVRKEAFEQLYSVYQQFQNTLANTLVSHVKMHNYKAKIRHYSSAREASLSNNAIPESVYDTLLKEVHEHLPLLHRYVALRKRLLKVKELHMYDMYTPLMDTVPLKYTYDEAKKKTIEALNVLGPDYKTHVNAAFQEGWIDVIENKGKRSGAYSSGAYDTNPYILLNWHDSLDQLYTLVHEMGHSIHSHYTRHHQPYIYGDYSIFLAEIASTTNENLLTEHLLAEQSDPMIRAYILNHYLDGFKGTVFRQSQFAEFEHFIHVEDQKGTPLTAKAISEYYGKLNATYYGNEVTKDSEIAFEWARIPHFYYNYYVYQYATGFCAATALSKKILTQKTEALDAYLTYLKAGNSDFPIEVMKKAGVDMTQSDYLKEAFTVFETRLNELEQLLNTLS